MKVRLATLATISLAFLASSAFAATSANDKTFATKAAQANLAEVAGGHIAIANGASEAVKNFGQRMIDDHGKSNAELTSAAAKAGITLPTAPSEEQQQAAARLKQETGMQFDKDYAQMMVKGHNEDIALFRKEAQSGTQPDLRAYATKTLPILQTHLELAKQLVDGK